MPKPPQTRAEINAFPGTEQGRRHRARILATLIDICRGLERLGVTPAARRASREVAARLTADLARERSGLARKR